MTHPTPLKAIRRQPASKAIRLKCLDCSETSAEVRECWNKECALYPYRMISGSPGGSKMKAIRRHCLSCCLGSQVEVRLCPAVKCPLHGYRAGKHPDTIAQNQILARNNAISGESGDDLAEPESTYAPVLVGGISGA